MPLVQPAPLPFMITTPESTPSPTTLNASVFQSVASVTTAAPWVLSVGMNVIGSVIEPPGDTAIADAAPIVKPWAAGAEVIELIVTVRLPLLLIVTVVIFDWLRNVVPKSIVLVGWV